MCAPPRMPRTRVMCAFEPSFSVGNPTHPPHPKHRMPRIGVRARKAPNPPRDGLRVMPDLVILPVAYCCVVDVYPCGPSAPMPIALVRNRRETPDSRNQTNPFHNVDQTSVGLGGLRDETALQFCLSLCSDFNFGRSSPRPLIRKHRQSGTPDSRTLTGGAPGCSR